MRINLLRGIILRFACSKIFVSGHLPRRQVVPAVGEAVATAALAVVDGAHGHGVDVGGELATAPTRGAGGVPFAVCLALAVGG